MPHNRPLDPGPGLTEGRIVLPDGRALRTVVAGEGPGPLVVFEAGMSAPAASWIHTQREISARCRTLSYDRAGYGGSDLDPHNRTLERIVDDLTALLDLLGESAPVVLVGHSWGGPIIRLFADRHPERVAGLVFVDATLAGVIPPEHAGRIRRSFQLMSVLARLGGGRLIMRLSLPHGTSAEISQSDLAIIRRDYASSRAMRAGAREARQIPPALPVLQRLQDTGTPAVPTVCLQGGRIDRGMATVRPELNRVAAELMSLVPQGKVVVVEQAGHLIPQECPAAVREAVLGVVDAVTGVR
ncbi:MULTISPECIES: alpha/beta fold hydrolase [unclassified Crossiella]|uniref:alpha/beta fold hydrolase n=1 Tax=unclassified Crossiella TaxID=2620835 RepID=UPI001FFFAE4D|nr:MULTISPECIES: alpha/beta hydrolase [unclassified Crossiella]MCK2239230.1 alpha/beta hydrolase [Crossiella sp. S99.2]MCK2251201.1 alpha/beta hydrolase [Crossiella sp. S99.1]